MTRELKNTTEVAEWLGTKPGVLAQWRYRGVGPRFIKVGRSVMYDVADLEAWLASQTFQGTAQAQAAINGAA